jgi:hypothetical protein
MYRVIADKLLELSEKHSEEIALQWYVSMMKNRRMSVYHGLPKKQCVESASFFYKNLKTMYFSKDPYREVERLLKQAQYVEEMYRQSVPLHEILYAQILMRRQIWVFAEFQALFNTCVDMHQTAETINRTILLFDYIIYIITAKYERLLAEQLAPKSA